MALQVIPKTEASVLVDATPSPIDRVVKRGQNAVLGRGLVRPFRRNANDFTVAEGVELVRSCVGQILGMNGSSEVVQGELEWDPERGSLLYLLRHQKNVLVVQELGRAYVINTLRRFEPRIVVKSVRTTKETAPTADKETILAIRLLYDVIRANVPGNQVLFSGIDQTVLLPGS